MSDLASTAQPKVSPLVRLPDRSRPAPTWHHAPVLTHRADGDRYRFLRLHAPEVAVRAQPGQFVMLTAARAGESAPALPRPMAVYRTDADRGEVEIVYGVVGEGTKRLSGFSAGETMLVVGPLGRGFQIGEEVRSTLLVGRGIGTCSLTTVAQLNAARGIATTAVISARSSGSLIGNSLYREFGARAVHEVTDDSGDSSPESLSALLIRDLDADPPQLILTCGSNRLTQLCGRLARRWDATVQVSVEAHMACGLGYCHGCATGMRAAGEESPLICADGPVFAWQAEPEVPR